MGTVNAADSGGGKPVPPLWRLGGTLTDCTAARARKRRAFCGCIRAGRSLAGLNNSSRRSEGRFCPFVGIAKTQPGPCDDTDMVRNGSKAPAAAPPSAKPRPAMNPNPAGLPMPPSQQPVAKPAKPQRSFKVRLSFSCADLALEPLYQVLSSLESERERRDYLRRFLYQSLQQGSARLPAAAAHDAAAVPVLTPAPALTAALPAASSLPAAAALGPRLQPPAPPSAAAAEATRPNLAGSTAGEAGPPASPAPDEVPATDAASPSSVPTGRAAEAIREALSMLLD